MGQHKHNPTAIKAKNGELPPKPKKPSKVEVDRLLYETVAEYIFEKKPITKTFYDMKYSDKRW